MPEYLTPLEDVWRALEGPYGDNATLYAKTVEAIGAANFPTSEVFAQRVLNRFLDKCAEQKIKPPYYEIAIYMMAAAGGLYEAEQLTKLPPNPAKYGYHGDNKLLGELRDRLLRQQRKALNPAATLEALTKCLVDVFIAITRHLPTIAQGSVDGDPQADSVLTLPLIETLPNVGAIIEHALKPFDYPEARQLGLFDWVRGRLTQNAERIAERSRNKHPIQPSHYDGSPSEIVSAYLEGTSMERLFLEARVPFQFPDEQRFSGHWIIAPPGRGKTTLLHALFLDDLERKASIIVMDSKGDLINPIKELKDIKDRLVLIEPDPDYPLALNPLDIPKTNIAHTISLLEYVFTALLEAKPTAKQLAFFRNVLPGIIQGIPNCNLHTFYDIVANGIGSYRQYLTHLPAVLRDFFDRQFDTQYADTRKEMLWRLDLMMANPVVKQMFTASKTKFDIGTEMDAGKVILVNNSKALLADEGSEFFGRFFIALVLAAAQQRANRPQSQKLPCFFYIDECQNVIRRDEKIPTILDECRSQKIALILAHQRSAQITSDNVLDALANCAIRMANSDDEAKYLADKFRCSADFLRSLPRGTFATYVRDLTPSALPLKIPFQDLSTMPRLTPAEQQEIRDRMRSQFAFIPTVAEAPAPPAPIPQSPLPASTPTPAISKQPPAPVRATTVASQQPPANDPDAGGHTDIASKWGQ